MNKEKNKYVVAVGQYDLVRIDKDDFAELCQRETAPFGKRLIDPRFVHLLLFDGFQFVALVLKYRNLWGP